MKLFVRSVGSPVVNRSRRARAVDRFCKALFLLPCRILLIPVKILLAKVPKGMQEPVPAML